MDNIILGLLLLQSRTIYQLRKRVDEGLNLMYSCSTGSIQAALKKLLNNGYVSVEDINENGKDKKLYSITESGKEYFNAWLALPIDNGKVKNPELSKIYFLGLTQKEIRIKIIRQHISDLKKIYTRLNKICDDGVKKTIKASDNDLLYYQLQTANYGRDFMKFNIEWYSRLLKNITEQQ